MGKLREKQSTFALNTAFLILESEKLGYSVTFGDAFRSDSVKYGHPNSLHRRRLAIDLNLFTADGEYITNDRGHKELHEWWEKNGGNPMIPGDPNHYSWPHGGML